MPTQPRSPSEHYTESERLLRVAEDAAIDPGIRDLAARMATAHAPADAQPEEGSPCSTTPARRQRATAALELGRRRGRQAVRFSFRTSRSTGVSVGIVGAVALGILLATTVFWVAVIVAAALVVAGLYAGAQSLWRHRR